MTKYESGPIFLWSLTLTQEGFMPVDNNVGSKKIGFKILVNNKNTTRIQNKIFFYNERQTMVHRKSYI